MVRNKYEEHLCEEVVFYPEYLWQFLPDRIYRDKLLAKFFLFRHILAQIFDVNLAKRVEYLEDMGEEFFINLTLQIAEFIAILDIKAFNIVSNRADKHLHSVDIITARDLVH